jgi:hypothetical protein
MRERGQAARAKWSGVVSEQVDSGQSVAAFCRERGLCTSHFFYWKKRLKQAETGQFLEVQVLPAGGSADVTAAHNRAIEVRLNSGRSLLVEPGFDADHLRALLAVVETWG